MYMHQRAIKLVIRCLGIVSIPSKHRKTHPKKLQVRRYAMEKASGIIIVIIERHVILHPLVLSSGPTF
jgi:hypothetical protein